ncbi:MAG: hypothetical protein OHK0023_04540 [Anaerolineae bacterium]
MIKKLPRQAFWINVYGYFFVAAAILSVAFILLTVDDLSWLEVALVCGLAILMAGLWMRFRPKVEHRTAASSAEFIDQLRDLGKQYTLVTLESDYCPLCMATGDRITQLDGIENLQIRRLSIHDQPGKGIFQDIDGRATPTYVLYDEQGKVLQEWVMFLPIERILYQVRQGQARQGRSAV